MTTKEKPKSNPTIRQKKLAKEISENLGTPMGKAMRKVGYSKEYSESPKQLTSTKSWQDLMEEYIPDTLLAEKHQALLNKKEQIVVRNGNTSEVVMTDEIDTQAVKAGVDMGYKLKGRFAPEQHEHIVKSIEIVKYNKKGK